MKDIADSFKIDCVMQDGVSNTVEENDKKSVAHSPRHNDIIEGSPKQFTYFSPNTHVKPHRNYSKDQQVSPLVFQEDSKNYKSSLKLPTINYKGIAKLSAQNGIEITNPIDLRHQTQIYLDPQIRLSGKGATVINKSLKDAKAISDPKTQNQLTSFLKQVQLKPLKRQDKSLTKNDLSLQELKQMKVNKNLILKLAKNINSNLQATKKTQTLKIKTQEKRQRFRKTDSKSIKNVQSSSKQKRLQSLVPPAPKNRKQKITNSYWDFGKFICLLNKTQWPQTPHSSYKAFVGKGNNSILIKNCLKNRFWWNIVDSDAEVNLHWTQCKDHKFIKTLKSSSDPPSSQQIKQTKEKHTKIFEFTLVKQTAQKTYHQSIKEYIGSGLQKLMSFEEKKRLSKNQLKAEIAYQPQFKKLGIPHKIKIHNHLQFHWNISNKKALYYNLKKFYQTTKQNPFEYIPLTFHIQKIGDQQWQNFEQKYEQRVEELKTKDSQSKRRKQKNLWIVKPGQNSNQGYGIQVYQSINQIKKLIEESKQNKNGRMSSFIVQKYLMPFLYNKRKFDIRCYLLVTSVNNIMKAYWYQQGYIRTSCKQFNLKNLKNRFIHLTNDSVQKKCQDYGKYENANKLSFSDFQKYLDNNYPDLKFFSTIYPAMIKRASDVLKSASNLMDECQREFTFEIFGLDYMIDEEFNTWLIQVNTNPCLELSSPLLARIIPNMIQNALRIAVDPFFPPPKEFSKAKTVQSDLFESNKFTLIFNSSEEQEVLSSLTKDTNLSHIGESDEEDENYDQIQ